MSGTEQGFWVQAYDGTVAPEIIDEMTCQLMYNPVTDEHAWQSVQWHHFVRRNV